MSYFVSLDGKDLRSVSPFIRIVDVVELRPDRTLTTHEKLAAPGSFVSRDHIAGRQIRVQFVILTSDPVRRTQALSDVTAWAMSGSRLQISDRPGQFLQVVCSESPLTMSKRKWTDLCEMTFSAFSVPFWENLHSLQVTASGLQTGQMHISPSGNTAQVPLRCRITPTSGTLTSLTLAANGSEMTFSGLAVPAGKTFTLEHSRGVLAAFWTDSDGSAIPCLSHRTGDEGIWLNTRQRNAVTFSADTPCDVTLLARGWYW